MEWSKTGGDEVEVKTFRRGITKKAMENFATGASNGTGNTRGQQEETVHVDWS
jgi:hypothetical protein